MYTLHRTRFDGLFYAHVGRNLWRFFVVENDTEHAVGPHYATRTELLGDLTRYAAFYGF